MLRRKHKGQSLTEFALILPLLLLLILGVFEAARVVWSYITVQAAAREAARYAITGRPHVFTGNSARCQDPENDLGGQPWICQPEDRAVAVKEKVKERAGTLAVSNYCAFDFDEYTVSTPEDDGECGDKPGAFGIAVIGQFVDSKSEPVKVDFKADFAGEQGLNVTIQTYYNIEMIDPVFNALMGGNFIRVEGAVQMQNEGLDQSLGFPPPPLPEVPISGEGAKLGTEPSVISQSGDLVEVNSDLKVKLLRHNPSGKYDIFFKNNTTSSLYPFSDCVALATDPDGEQVVDCRIVSSVPPGDYQLFSTNTGVSAAYGYYGTAEDPNLITVVAGITPRVEIQDGNIWAAGSPVKIDLLNHDVSDELFDLIFVGDAGEQVIASNLSYDTTDFAWTVPNVGATCPQFSATPCQIFTRSDNPAADDPYAETQIWINDPKITLSQGIATYPQGALLIAFLEGHTPNHDYDVWLKSTDGGGIFVPLDDSPVSTDSVGQFSAIDQFVLPAWPNGAYELQTFEVGDTTSPIATKEITIDTPVGPFITVDGGYTWPIDSFINIRVHQHTEASHYLNFGSWRVGTGNGHFNVPASGSEVMGYRIPITAAIGASKAYSVTSHLASDNSQQASKNVTVVPVPVILIHEGDTALPNATITIEILNHSPNSSYTIFYGKEISNPNGVGKQLFTMITDATGGAKRTYDLSDLPASPPPNFSQPDTCACYGKPYHMYSQALDGSKLAFTNLTIDSADLVITNIEYPPNVAINTTIPVTYTIQNLKPVTISRYFDVDLYLDPAPLVPSYTKGQFNFPGDVKYWRNFVAPNGQPGDTFTIVHDEFFMGDYGDHELYGHADTTDYLLFEDSETNNINSVIVNVPCDAPFINPANLNWKLNAFGSSTDIGGATSTSGSTAVLESDGMSTFGSNDNASNRGHLWAYHNQPIATNDGVEIVVRMTEAPSPTSYAKGGISLRNDLDPAGMKVDFGLSYSGGGKHGLQAAARRDVSANVVELENSAQVTVNGGTPVWLRIERLPNSDTFNFYYKQQSAEPTDWGTPYKTSDVGMNDDLYIGLFNASYSNNTQKVSRFDNFKFTDTSICTQSLGAPPVAPPPGLTLCSDVLAETSFETAPSQAWIFQDGPFLAPSVTGSKSGRIRLAAHTFDTAFRRPVFYQQFTMPSWVISTTTSFNLNFYRNVDSLVSGDDPNDQYYAVVSTSPTVATAVTTPTLIAQGLKTSDWEFTTAGLSLNDGATLETFAGQPLYLYVYNNSNTGCGTSCTHSTEYYFDDMQLTTCTSQPPPDTVTNILRGSVTLHRLGGSGEKLAGVKVWTYTENGELFETFTMQDGTYIFYNLPIGSSGSEEYIIYAEYNFVDALNPNLVETLATDTSVVMTNNPNPVVVNLDLYTIFD